jgi:hypothetical protein
MKSEYQSDSAEDVSFAVVPGSIGRVVLATIPWGPRRSPASDKARAEAMTAMQRILSKYRQRPRSAPVSKADFQAARDNFWSNKNAGMGFSDRKGGRR